MQCAFTYRGHLFHTVRCQTPRREHRVQVGVGDDDGFDPAGRSRVVVRVPIRRPPVVEQALVVDNLGNGDVARRLRNNSVLLLLLGGNDVENSRSQQLDSGSSSDKMLLEASCPRRPHPFALFARSYCFEV